MSTFSNQKKVEALAVAVADEMPYIKKSQPMISQGEMENKGYGMQIHTYIDDPGKVYDGLETIPEGVTQIEYSTTLKNKNTNVEYDSWDKLVNIRDFKQKIINKKAVKLAKTVQDDVIKSTIYRSCQAVVTTGDAGFDTLSEGAAKLSEVAVAGEKVSFMSPSTMGKIAAGGLAKFIPDEMQKKIYSKNYLGEYAGASQIQCQGLPVITTPSNMAATISLTEETSGRGLNKVTSVSITGGVDNASIPFRAEGLKIVDVNGLETDQDYIIFADKNGNIPDLRITYKGENYNNPNAWVASGTTALTLEPVLATGTKYEVGSVRIADALGFDTYKFNHMPATEEFGTETVDGVRLECVAASDVLKRTSIVRIDCPYAAQIAEPRQNVTVFVKK